ncbi:cold shock domain-containing protein [Natronobacterium texcoconense]|uniref:Cold shock protein, CspA family n=1 Tax=Natronobacterium texcoconense TaxID=1095778 RepID=A0A1H1FZE0_NATTX|nr:cold shock domain-containing protein [Natronobacterium texcoconense]SDR06332.1 Cold shock protein, CspA family [Natronobacterium texcoconense]
MPRFECETCGESFNSKMNLEYHQDLVDCSAPEPSPNEESSSQSSPRELVEAEATGTVITYDEDRGFGFVATTDVTRTLSNGDELMEEAFFHISDIDSTWIEEGDRLQFDVIRNEKGLKCEDIEIVSRNRDRESYDKPEDDYTKSRLGFGHQKDDTKYGPGKASPTELDIENFRDERKFR